MVKFDYLEPGTLEDACALLERHGEEARLIAGGTSLMIWMRQRLLSPRVLISLAKIPNFEEIRFDPRDGLCIAAGARHRDIELSLEAKKHYPLLHETFRKVAQPRIRNMGTIGGNLCQGDPLTDPGASLMALDAELTLFSKSGMRILPIEKFFVDYYETALKPGEILTQIRVPPPIPGQRWAHIKFLPRSLEDFATVGVAMTWITEGRSCKDLRLALNSVGPTIFRARKAEEVLRGREIEDDSVRRMGEIAAQEADPMDDNRGSPEYKRDIIKVLVRRAAQEAVQRAS